MHAEWLNECNYGEKMKLECEKVWLWSGYGYGTVPGGRWTIDTEGGHVVVSVSLMRNGYEYGTVPDRRGTIHTESGHVVNSVSRMRSHPEYVVAMKHVEIGIQATALTSDDLDTPSILCCL